MKRDIMKFWGICSIAFLMISFTVSTTAELKISITISGDLDEMLPILQQLKETIGEKTQTSKEKNQIQVHSIVVGSEFEQETEITSEPPLSSQNLPILSEPLLVPNVVQPGKELTLSVHVLDPNHVIDTVSAEISFPESLLIDLVDKGDEGDTVAGDNIWSRKLIIPQNIPAGTYKCTIKAFNADGKPVEIPQADGTTQILLVTTNIEVIP